MSGWAVAGGFARVNENARLNDNAQVNWHGYVHGNAELTGQSRVTEYAEVYGDARIMGKARIGGNARVGGNAMLDDGVYETGDYPTKPATAEEKKDAANDMHSAAPAAFHTALLSMPGADAGFKKKKCVLMWPAKVDRPFFWRVVGSR